MKDMSRQGQPSLGWTEPSTHSQGPRSRDPACPGETCPLHSHPRCSSFKTRASTQLCPTSLLSLSLTQVQLVQLSQGTSTDGCMSCEATKPWLHLALHVAACQGQEAFVSPGELGGSVGILPPMPPTRYTRTHTGVPRLQCVQKGHPQRCALGPGPAPWSLPARKPRPGLVLLPLCAITSTRPCGRPFLKFSKPIYLMACPVLPIFKSRPQPN